MSTHTHKKKHLYINVHNSVIYKSQKTETTQVSINWCTDFLNVVYFTIDYYSAIKKEWNIHAATWMDLESIMPSERNQRLKATYCMILFIGNVQNRQICRDRKQMCGCQLVERKRNWKVWSFLLWWRQCSGMIWWWCLHNIVNIPKPAVSHIVNMLYELYLSKKKCKRLFSCWLYLYPGNETIIESTSL